MSLSNVVLTEGGCYYSGTRLSRRDALSATVEQPTQATVTPVIELEKNDNIKNHIHKKKKTQPVMDSNHQEPLYLSSLPNPGIRWHSIGFGVNIALCKWSGDENQSRLFSRNHHLLKLPVYVRHVIAVVPHLVPTASR